MTANQIGLLLWGMTFAGLAYGVIAVAVAVAKERHREADDREMHLSIVPGLDDSDEFWHIVSEGYDA